MASFSELVARQRAMARRVERRDRFGRIRFVAGADVSIRDDRAQAAVVVLSFPALDVVEIKTARRRVTFPYIPGLLAFREVPILTAAFRIIRQRPDLVLVDGQGLAHPRRCGLACHVGLEWKIPTIGCAKSLYVGTHDTLGDLRGDHVALKDDGETIGAVLRTRDGVKPIFVSIGHRVSLATAVALVLACGKGLRLPEPTRLADHAAAL